MPDRRVALLLAALAGYAAVYAVLLHRDTTSAPLVTDVAGLVGFALLVPLARWAEPRTSRFGLLVLGGAVLLQVVALTVGPTSSDDVYRYLWDARVQFAGVDPYAHAPASAALAPLRDHLLFPGGACPHPIPGSCTLINRPTVHTVYPPAAQLGFDAVRLLSGGGHGGVHPFQLAGALGVLAVTIVLLRWRPRQPQRRLWPVTLWAWSPLAVLEYGNNAHIDWLAVLFSLGALAAARGRRAVWSGILLAGAILTKLYPALLVPALVRRDPIRVIVAAVVTGAVLYLPHVLADGAGVIGYLPGYLQEEGYDSGARLQLLGAVLPHPADTIVGVLLLLAAAWWCVRHADPEAPERSAVVFVGVAFLIVTPSYGWYAGLLLALAVAAGRWEWVPVACAPPLAYLILLAGGHTQDTTPYVYLGAGLLLVAGLVARTRRGSGKTAAEPAPAR